MFTGLGKKDLKLLLDQRDWEQSVKTMKSMKEYHRWLYLSIDNMEWGIEMKDLDGYGDVFVSAYIFSENQEHTWLARAELRSNSHIEQHARCISDLWNLSIF